MGLYIKGPNASWDWPGVCETTDDGQQYCHRTQWPVRQAWESFTRFSPRPLADLLANKEWVPLNPHPVHVQVPEGL